MRLALHPSDSHIDRYQREHPHPGMFTPILPDKGRGDCRRKSNFITRKALTTRTLKPEIRIVALTGPGPRSCSLQDRDGRHLERCGLRRAPESEAEPSFRSLDQRTGDRGANQTEVDGSLIASRPNPDLIGIQAMIDARMPIRRMRIQAAATERQCDESHSTGEPMKQAPWAQASAVSVHIQRSRQSLLKSRPESRTLVSICIIPSRV